MREVCLQECIWLHRTRLVREITMCAAKLLKRNKNNNVAAALVTTKRSINEYPCCNAGGAPDLVEGSRAARSEGGGRRPRRHGRKELWIWGALGCWTRQHHCKGFTVR